MFKEQVVIDGRGHLLGRLAATIAKEVLNGQKVVVVRCEEINISGSLYRNRLKYSSFLRKRMNTNPRRGPFHHRQPSKILWRTVRGMMPHKTARGAAALDRLKVFDGIPAPFDKMKRMVVPQALKVIRLKPHRRFCRLGDMAASVGWNHDDLIKRLEEKRKVRSEAFHKKRVALTKLKQQAAAAATKALSADEQKILARVNL
eukprot:GDKI01019118.1.p1 GENE.GDKI01019118.1~~GDKI01019118.1.p1  ORF type:complete len:202 (-),score=81.57 GDKI01019118.1:175-780(-)